MEDMGWVLYALLGTVLVTQVVLIVLAAERGRDLTKIVEAISGIERLIENQTLGRSDL